MLAAVIRAVCRTSEAFFRQLRPVARPEESIHYNEVVLAIDTPAIIPRPAHTISRSNISENALKVLYRLSNAGFQAYLVGGGVRDLLLARHPKDFDVVTDAHPEKVRELFRNCRLIGRRFLLAHVVFGRDVIEVATFRAGAGADVDDDGDNGAAGEDLLHHASGRILRDNIYGTLDDDVWRRDFTVNALYYNIADYSVVDYAGGMEDIQQRIIRPIGDPHLRFREDPVRMLRAIRFAAKLDFNIDPAAEAAIIELRDLLHDVPSARLFDETLKLFLGGAAARTFHLLRHYGVFGVMFPEVETALRGPDGEICLRLLQSAVHNTDVRVAEGRPVTPAFLFAAFLWHPVRMRLAKYLASGMEPNEALAEAAGRIVEEHTRRVALPKRFSVPMREIWMMQPRLERIAGRKPMLLLEHPRFRAAYDFLLLRGESGEVDAELGNWWTEFQAADPEARALLLKPAAPVKRRRRVRRKKKSPPSA